MIRHAGNALSGERRCADDVIHVAKVRVVVCGANGKRARLHVDADLSAAAHGPTGVSEVATTVAIRDVEGHELVARARLECRNVPMDARTAEQALGANLERDRALWIQLGIDARGAVRLVAEFRRRWRLEARRHVR